MHVTVPGLLTVVSSSEETQTVDVDLRLYLSDESGTPVELYDASTGGSADEGVSFDAAGGEWVLVEANYATVVGGTYDGVATFTPAPTP